MTYKLVKVNANDKCPPIGPLHDKCKRNDEDSSSTNSVDYINESSENTENVSATTGTGTVKGKNLSWAMLFAAAAALAGAVAAVIVGQQGKQKQHQLKGVVARRKALFQNFADNALWNPWTPTCINCGERNLDSTFSKEESDRCSV